MKIENKYLKRFCECFIALWHPLPIIGMAGMCLIVGVLKRKSINEMIDIGIFCIGYWLVFSFILAFGSLFLTEKKAKENEPPPEDVKTPDLKTNDTP